VPLDVGLRERLAVLTLTVLILLGGLFPQSGVASRYRAAAALLHTRENRLAAGAEPEFDQLGPDARSRLAVPQR
jgi:NADH-quinone oxidoreductase subunit M